MKRLLLLSLSFSLFISCKNRKDVSIVNPPEQKTEWSEIEISLDNQRFNIFHKSDTAFFGYWDFKKVFKHKPTFSVDYQRINVKDTFFIISKLERDSLAKYIYNLITKPSFTHQFVTDYVGNIDFQLRSGGTSLSCEYSSVGDWTTISEQTEKIYGMLKAKVDISTH